MPFFGPSLAGRSNSTTGTFTLTRWAAICAPITPAPSTATFFTWNRDICLFLGWWDAHGAARQAPRHAGGPAAAPWRSLLCLLHALPGLGAPERAPEAAHPQPP